MNDIVSWAWDGRCMGALGAYLRVFVVEIELHCGFYH